MTRLGSPIGRRPLAAGLLVAMLVGATTAVPASAAVILGQTGQPGVYVVADQDDLPGARCGYSAENAAGDAFFRWMRFRKPDVYSDGAAQQKVGVTFRLQRSTGGAWETVESSSQTDTALKTEPADFVDQKLYYRAQAGDLLRGVVMIRWFRGGSVVGMVKLRLEHYSVKWTVGTPDYQFVDACDGASD